ncbi:MAG: tRNA uridine(34) 5-carboxymethylaminomethyl modification radical SAM/GNAT enzyme Elp3 [Anaerolineales bacterium]|nr:tRNA uridine(34) 5-carboxymethylaminomethyl modification radical SAM/GNAT enzyme Elp3 [Anaerolineales bacterium]MCS7248645.1 tRNA uridine(34) 5-carboxymethylaminomethyl modification radical SAM/GNAT enzyme Elp3 [Anaerolineales bacterium]MDW8162458.1 tRNA uridine(34) 5-carboxymethylaminomethyl modification radical SAM/GNAT enzyme Elp3 [Anaerolineales bacterium]MDW8447893.1 tRNA uridine(34) 5-carboxymethylaminomethyl modification radical SAM/GNAT enzyme Elp3 [Anaerolineales bacterium]
MVLDRERWQEKRRRVVQYLDLAESVVEQIRQGSEVSEALRRNPLPGGGHLGKNALVAAYHRMVAEGKIAPDPQLLARLRLKPVRTSSGVTTVTVLTKPYPCPAKCIFCPTEENMPKSYLADEPGARRAVEHHFDPYDQVFSRMQALAEVGHPTEKIELLILGGTWSAYRRDYQEWFIRRCFDAMNGVPSATLAEAFSLNETAAHRNVGLVIETRPDEITAEELIWLRRLGVTKVQMGAQSFDDEILALNRRGHTVGQTRQAVNLLRRAGFKIVLHWMPNLLGATPEKDRRDFQRMWEGFCPDEIKIYPTQLLENTELYTIWKAGGYRPYTTQELIELLVEIMPTIPRYCRVNRVIRDIPSTYVVEGNKVTNLRQEVDRELQRRGMRCQCIRCREIGQRPLDPRRLRTESLVYSTDVSEEHFLSFVTEEDYLAGFLRLSLPQEGGRNAFIEELREAALIREVHVYGQSLELGQAQPGAAQHRGLGTRLLRWAERLARERGYPRLAVISAVGTRQYYLQRGFRRGELYLIKDL